MRSCRASADHDGSSRCNSSSHCSGWSPGRTLRLACSRCSRCSARGRAAAPPHQRRTSCGCKRQQHVTAAVASHSVCRPQPVVQEMTSSTSKAACLAVCSALGHLAKQGSLAARRQAVRLRGISAVGVRALAAAAQLAHPHRLPLCRRRRSLLQLQRRPGLGRRRRGKP